MSFAIPKRHLEKLLYSPMTDTDAMLAVREPFSILVLSGGVGAGKTMAACSWLHRLGAGAFMTAAQLARYPRYDMKAMDELLSHPALVVDDLGTEYMDEKGNFMAILDELVNSRYSSELPTLLTTNWTAAEFKGRYKARIYDRIVEVGRWVSLADESMRRRQAEEERAAFEQARSGAETERAAEAKEAARLARRSLCKLHVYGSVWEPDAVCNEDCPQWKAPAVVGMATP